MEIHFQQPPPPPPPYHLQVQEAPGGKPAKLRARSSRGTHHGGGGSKFVGVRQRPSGRWVAEIKDTTQKIRMWLGTFETAEEAALAYDEAACLLRGSNTRTNFLPRAAAASNSPLASRIRSLLHHKKLAKSGGAPSPPPPSTSVPAASTAVIAPCTLSTSTTTTTTSATATTATTTTTTTTSSSSTITSCNNASSISGTSSAATPETDTCHEENQAMGMDADDDVYRPCFSNDGSEFHLGTSTSDLSWILETGVDRLPPFTQEGFELPRQGLSPEEGGGEGGMSEFERMQVERQISASLYAINGVHEYLEAVHDSSSDALWDLPPLCQLFCHS